MMPLTWRSSPSSTLASYRSGRGVISSFFTVAILWPSPSSISIVPRMSRPSVERRSRSCSSHGSRTAATLPRDRRDRPDPADGAACPSGIGHRASGRSRSRWQRCSVEVPARRGDAGWWLVLVDDPTLSRGFSDRVLFLWQRGVSVSRSPRRSRTERVTANSLLTCETRAVRVLLLGPVGAEVGGAAVPLGGPKQRAVFTLLALNAGRVVSLDRLIQELWSDEPPARSTLTLQSYVSRLRRVLGHAATNGDAGPQILTRPPGWILTVDPSDVDAMQFAGLVDEARRLLGDGPAADASRAMERLQTALGLWHGDALADLEAVSFAREEAVRLGEIRLSATELLLEARLAQGEPGSVAEEARRFVVTNPFRERAWCALMLGLYRSGRQSEAIAAAAELRGVLADELGVDLSPDVQNLEQLILRQDPSLRGVGNGNAWTAPQSHSTATPRPAATEIPAIPPLGQQLLVGRTDVLAILDECVASATAGSGRLLVLNAPAGYGKSTMLDALAERTRDASGIVVRGGGAGAGAMPPLWPWVSIVRQLATSDAANDDPRVNAAIGTALKLLEPTSTPAARSGGEENAQ